MNDFERKSRAVDRQGIAALLFCGIVALAALYFIFRYALGIFLPFIIAWALALMTEPLSRRLSERLKISKKLCAAVITSLLLALIFTLLTLAFDRLVFEAQRLLSWLAEDSARLGESIASFFDKITSIGNKRVPLIENLMKIEQFREVWENIDKVVASAISEMVSALTRGIPGAMINTLSRLPSLFLFLIVTVISCFYFSLDLERINAAFVSIFPVKWQERLPKIKKRMGDTAVKYVRAYLLLLFLTFSELLVGFWLIGVPYPLLIAFLVALVDILPVLGVGSVLLPWAAIEIFISKDLFTGIGLIIIYVIVTVIRQISEPKVVAGSLGLHPLVTIIAMYTGFKIFGILGMIAGPMVALAIKSFVIKPCG